MLAFITEHLVEILFGLISTGALAACRYFYKQLKQYKQLLQEKKDETLVELIDEKLQPVLEDIEELRGYIRKIEIKENQDLTLIISSYRFRLVQLCKIYIKQGYMTQDQYDQLTEFYKLYHSLGGNGQAKEYYEKTMELEIRPE